MEFRAFDDLDPKTFERLLHPSDELPAIAGISPYEDKTGKTQEFLFEFHQNQSSSIAILNVGRMHDDRDDQSECINNNMSFPSIDFLSRIVAFDPPFCVFTD